jgi:hypothetical protein
MKHLSLVVVVVGCTLLSGMAVGGEIPSDGHVIAELRKRVAGLEKEVAVLRMIVDPATSISNKRELRERKRKEAMRRIGQLREQLSAAREKAKDSPALKDLGELARHSDVLVRERVVSVLSRYPKDVGGKLLAVMVGDQELQVARKAIEAMGIVSDYSSKDVVAARAEGLMLESRTPYISGRGAVAFLIVACNYLYYAGDVRAVRIFMAHLDRELKRAKLNQGTRSNMFSWGLLAKDAMVQADRWTGGKVGFLPPKKHGYLIMKRDQAQQAAVKLLGWWKKNGKDFTLNIEPKKSVPEDKPEKF